MQYLVTLTRGTKNDKLSEMSTFISLNVIRLKSRANSQNSQRLQSRAYTGALKNSVLENIVFFLFPACIYSNPLPRVRRDTRSLLNLCITSSNGNEFSFFKICCQNMTQERSFYGYLTIDTWRIRVGFMLFPTELVRRETQKPSPKM